MTIGISSLRITGIEQLKKYLQWEAGDCIKTMENDTSPLEMQYNRNHHHGTYGSSYMNCYVFKFYCELFTVVAIFDL